MKKVFIYSLLCLANLSLLSCSGGGEKKSANVDVNNIDRDIKFESFTFDLIGEITHEEDSIPEEGWRYIRYIAQGVVPQDTGADNIKQLRDTLLKIASVRFLDSTTPEPDIDDSIRITDIQPSDINACGEEISNLSTTLVTPRAVVWECKSYSYPCGAAHGYTTTTYINYSINDGKILEYPDLMIAGYEKPLAKLIQDKIKEKNIQLLTSLSEINVPDEFELTPSGIIFSYDPYFIAPYSEGTVQIELSAYELEEILSTEGKYILLGIIE